MDKEICLDTDICIEVIKGNPDINKKISDYSSMEVYITSVSLFELFLRKFNLPQVEEFVKDTVILPFDEYAAKKASELFKEMKKSGNPVADFRDLFIASTCIANNMPIVTLNKKDFKKIKGLKILDI